MGQPSASVANAPLPVLVGPFVSERGWEVLQNLGVGFIDLAGNCWIARGAFYLEVRGRPNPRPKRQTPMENVFRGDRASARILRVALARAGEPLRFARLADDAEVSLGLVHSTVERLREQGYVAGPKGDERIRDPRSVLRKFAETYQWERTTHVEPFFTLLSTADLRDKLVVWARRAKVPLAFTLASGLRPEEVTVPSSLTALYSGAAPFALAEALNLSRVPTGANLLLLNASPRAATDRGGVYGFPRDLPWGPGVSPVQLYIDLHAQGGRSRDQAEEMLRGAAFPW